MSDTFDTKSSLDYNDVFFGEKWWTSQNGTGRVVVRIPLSEIAAKSTIHFGYTGGTDALWSHLTQNATNSVYWAGHVSSSELRVYSMRDGDGFYSWRSVTVNSWPNGARNSLFNNYYGFGWFLGEIGGHKYADHGGVIPSGFSSDIIRFSDDRLTIIVLTNRAADDILASDAPRPWDIAKGVASLYIPTLIEKVK